MSVAQGQLISFQCSYNLGILHFNPNISLVAALMRKWCFILDQRQTSLIGVQRRMISVVNFFCIFEIIIFCFVVAICDLVHDLETISHLSYVLTASGNLF